MPHALELKYGLTSAELLDAIDRRSRLKVALEGAVAEVHFERKLAIAKKDGWILDYESHDIDGMHDCTVHTLNGLSIRFEVKTIRNSLKPQVELQKTRTSNSDPSSRFYDTSHFDIVAVCVGRKTGDWSDFRYAVVSSLPAHNKYAHKLKVMNDVPITEVDNIIWYDKLKELFDDFRQ